MRYPRVIFTDNFPRLPFAGISLCGFIFFRRDCHVGEREIRHELIHFRQQLEWGFLIFFILYIAEYGYYLHRFHNKDRAYRAISFECEAYDNEDDIDYLKKRRHWANYRKG